MVLSALTNGTPPKELDPVSMEFLQSSAKRLAVRLGNGDTRKEREFLENWNLEKTKIYKSYAKKVFPILVCNQSIVNSLCYRIQQFRKL